MYGKTGPWCTRSSTYWSPRSLDVPLRCYSSLKYRQYCFSSVLTSTLVSTPSVATLNRIICPTLNCTEHKTKFTLLTLDTCVYQHWCASWEFNGNSTISQKIRILPYNPKFQKLSENLKIIRNYLILCHFIQNVFFNWISEIIPKIWKLLDYQKITQKPPLISNRLIWSN